MKKKKSERWNGKIEEEEVDGKKTKPSCKAKSEK